MKHTKVPWAQSHREQQDGSGDYSTEIYDSNGTVIATLAWYPVKNGNVTTTAREENARRIVACVNACEGISTDDLERHYTVDGGIDSAMEEASLKDHVSAIKQRNELLAALKDVVRHFTQTPSTLADTTCRGKAHELIAKIEAAA